MAGKVKLKVASWPGITAGPWRIVKDVKLGPPPEQTEYADLYILDSPTRRLMGVMEYTRLRKNYAHSLDTLKEHRQGKEEVEANAKAAAAVPELLDAIKDCLPDLIHYADTHGTGPDVRLSTLMQVLEKAGCKLTPV